MTLLISAATTRHTNLDANISSGKHRKKNVCAHNLPHKHNIQSSQTFFCVYKIQPDLSAHLVSESSTVVSGSAVGSTHYHTCN